MTRSPSAGPSELRLRIASATALAAVAILAAWLGGLAHALVWTAAGVLCALEWQRAVHGAQAPGAQAASAAAVVAAGAGAWAGSWPVMLGAFAAALPIGLFLGGRQRGETGLGPVYGGALAAAAILCRGAGAEGFLVMLWLFAVVWGTDTIAYFAGRAIGGPKLWPRVSPKKTWSGALGGLCGGTALGLVVLSALGAGVGVRHVALSIAFSLATQAGDLFESAFKRRHDVKDAGALIPGHGGAMDRLDGFIFAAALAALVGVWTAGFADAPRGLLGR